MRACIILAPALLLAGCHGSGADGAPVLAAATIGPDGGVIAIDGGVQEGLVLTIPPGSLAEPTRVLIRDGTRALPPGTAATTEGPGVARPFFLEPAGLALAVPGTLRAPYRVVGIEGTAPGNVRLREVRSGGAIDHDPLAVDAVAGFVEHPIRFLSWFQVRLGDVAPGITSYWPAVGAVAPLTNGWSFAVSDALPPPALPNLPTLCWRILGPGGEERFWFAHDALVGREHLPSGMREAWAVPFPVWTPAQQATLGGASVAIEVSYGGSSLQHQGMMTAFSMWHWTMPRAVGASLLRDVVRLHLSLVREVAGFGVEQRDYRFTFAPGIGLVALSVDGVEQVRTDL